MASGAIASWEIDGETVARLFWGAPKSLQMVTAAMKLKNACSLEEKLMTNLDSILKSRDISLPMLRLMLSFKPTFTLFFHFHQEAL